MTTDRNDEFDHTPHRFKPSRHLRDCCTVCGEPRHGGRAKHTMPDSIHERDSPPCPECPGTHGQHYPDCGVGADERWAERVKRYVEARDRVLMERNDDE